MATNVNNPAFGEITFHERGKLPGCQRRAASAQRPPASRIRARSHFGHRAVVQMKCVTAARAPASRRKRARQATRCIPTPFPAMLPSPPSFRTSCCCPLPGSAHRHVGHLSPANSIQRRPEEDGIGGNNGSFTNDLRFNCNTPCLPHHCCGAPRSTPMPTPVTTADAAAAAACHSQRVD